MGKPSTTYFCGNGHLLEHNAEHEFGDYDFEDTEGRVCKVCGNAEVFSTCDWLDPDYDQLVPSEPISVDTKTGPCPCCGQECTREIPVYDISVLRARREHPEDFQNDDDDEEYVPEWLENEEVEEVEEDDE